MDLGFAALRLDVTGTRSIAELQQRLRDYAAAHPNDAWIVGFGWNQEMWPEKRFPTSADLDAVVSDRPVVLERVDGHAVVANSAALKAAGSHRGDQGAGGRRNPRRRVRRQCARPDRPGDPDADRCAEATRRWPRRRSNAARLRGHRRRRDEHRRRGLEGVPPRGRRRAAERAADELFVGHRVDCRPVPKPTGWLYGDHLRAVGIKLFADGALGSRGAWLKQPYADKPDTRGLQFHSDAEMLASPTPRPRTASRSRPTRSAMPPMRRSSASTSSSPKKYPGDRRWRIEHFQIVDPADIPRLAPAGIIASMQPTHQTSDRLMAEKRLGPNRLAGAYAWQSVLKSGARLAFGTDFPVEAPTPSPASPPRSAGRT